MEAADYACGNLPYKVFRFKFQTANLRYASAFSRRDAPELCMTYSLDNKGAGNAGCPLHPQPRVRCDRSTRAYSPQVHRRCPASPAQWFYGLYRALPGDEFVLSPSSADMACLSPVGPTHLREFNTSNGCQNHTALPYAKSVCRLRAVDRSRDPALRYVTRPTLPRPPHPAPRP